MEIINLTVSHQCLTCDRKSLVSDTRNVYECHFTFDEEWENFGKTAVFKYGNEYLEMVLDNDVCILPHEAISERGYLQIGVYGSSETQTYPTIFAPSLLVISGAYMGQHADPTPDIYEQLVALYNQLLTTKQDKLPPYLKDKYLKVVEVEDEEGTHLELSWQDGGGGGGGVDLPLDYANTSQITNQPQINGYTLVGNKSATSLGLALKDNLDNTIAILNTATGNITLLQNGVSALNTDVANLELEIGNVPTLISEAISTHNQSSTAHDDIRDDIDEVREIAGGLRTNYVCSAITNPILDSTDDIITLTGSLTDIEGNTITIEQLKIGDNVYVSQLDFFDRWYAGNGQLYRLETAKVPVHDVKFKNVSVVQNEVANIPSNLSDFDDDSTHRLVTDTEKSTWNGKQNAISDLATIRSGASKGATSLQKPSTFQVGQFFKVASIDSEGNPVLQAVSIPSGIKLAGTLQTPDSDGNVNIPMGADGVKGLCTNNGNFGVEERGFGLAVKEPTNSKIDSRLTYIYASYWAPTLSKIDYTVKKVLCDGLGPAWTDTEKNGAWQRLTIIKTTMDSVAVANANYFLGEQSSVSITLPTGNAGEKIHVVFYSGTTATTLSVTNSYLGELPTPNANERIELSFLHDGTNWCLLSNAMAVPSEEE